MDLNWKKVLPEGDLEWEIEEQILYLGPNEYFGLLDPASSLILPGLNELPF